MDANRDFDVFRLTISADNSITYGCITYNNQLIMGPGEKVADNPDLREDISHGIDDLTAGRLDGRQDDIRRLGRNLYRAIFPGEVGSVFERELKEVVSDRATNVNRWLRIVIEVHPKSEVFGWPLEFLYCPRNELWLATERSYIALSRHLTVHAELNLQPQARPLRTLVIISDPAELPGVIATKVLEEIGRLADVTPESGTSPEVGMEVKVVGRVKDYQRQIPGIQYLEQPAEYSLLMGLIRDWRPHVLHFIGHGRREENEGALALTKDDHVDWVNADDISQLFSAWQPRLVLLQACQSAVSGTEPGFMSLADRIFKRSIPAVVAMQFQITNDYASQFAQGFYEALRDGKDVDAAVQIGRAKITTQVRWTNRDFGAPVLFTYEPDAIVQPFSRRTPKFSTPTFQAPATLEKPLLTTAQRLSRDIQKAMEYLENGDLDVAKDWIEDVLKEADQLPRAVQLRLNDAKGLVEQGEPKPAADRLSKALSSLEASPALLQVGMGKVLESTQDKLRLQASTSAERTLS